MCLIKDKAIPNQDWLTKFDLKIIQLTKRVSIN